MQQEQQFRDPAIEPTQDCIATALGPASDSYTKFTQHLPASGISIHWRYYTDGKAWLGKGLCKWSTVRGAKKEATLFWLSIWESFFKVTFYIPEKYRTEALCLPLSDDTLAMISAAKQMGKLKFFPLMFDVSSDQLLDDVLTLVAFKKVIK